jgi:hypothetical protein
MNFDWRFIHCIIHWPLAIAEITNFPSVDPSERIGRLQIIADMFYRSAAQKAMTAKQQGITLD